MPRRLGHIIRISVIEGARQQCCLRSQGTGRAGNLGTTLLQGIKAGAKHRPSPLKPEVAPPNRSRSRKRAPIQHRTRRFDKLIDAAALGGSRSAGAAIHAAYWETAPPLEGSKGRADEMLRARGGRHQGWAGGQASEELPPRRRPSAAHHKGCPHRPEHRFGLRPRRTVIVDDKRFQSRPAATRPA